MLLPGGGIPVLVCALTITDGYGHPMTWRLMMRWSRPRLGLALVAMNRAISAVPGLVLGDQLPQALPLVGPGCVNSRLLMRFEAPAAKDSSNAARLPD